MSDIYPGMIPKRTPNRYSRIHVLFRKIAEAQGYHQVKISHLNFNCKYCDLNDAQKKVKSYWKKFFSVGSLTELSDDELKNLEDLLEKRLKKLQKER